MPQIAVPQLHSIGVALLATWATEQLHHPTYDAYEYKGCRIDERHFAQVPAHMDTYAALAT